MTTEEHKANYIGEFINCTVDASQGYEFNLANFAAANPLDRHSDVNFRGKPLTDLSAQELREALAQALDAAKMAKRGLPF